VSSNKPLTVAPTSPHRDPLGLLRQMTSELDRVFDEPFWRSLRRQFHVGPAAGEVAWSPGVDVFEKNHRLVTRVDLPGMKKEDVKVEVTDGHLAISGERRTGTEEKRDTFYRCEREYGSFYRTVPLPEGVKLDDVKATFSDGVLEVSVPLPAKLEPTIRTVTIEEPATAAKTVA
jgi:HSP20 family protein